MLIPAHGPSPYLPQALASILAATDDECAVTVVDDGSPGDEVAAAVRSAGPLVEYVRLNQNLGVAGAFQRCVELSRGTYTVLMGSDDLAETCYVAELRRLVTLFDAPAMVLPGVAVIDCDGATVKPMPDRVKGWLAPHGEARVLSGDRLAASLLTGNWLYFPAMAWRTDLLRKHGFKQDMQTALDLDLEMRLIFEGGRLAWSSRPAFRYRRHSASFSSRSAVSGKRFKEEQVLFRWVGDEAAERGWRLSRLAARAQVTSRIHGHYVRIQRLSRVGQLAQLSIRKNAGGN